MMGLTAFLTVGASGPSFPFHCFFSFQSAAIPTNATDNLGSTSKPSAFPPMLSGGGSTKTITVVAGHHLPPLPVDLLKNDLSAPAAYVRADIPPAVAAPASLSALTTPVSKINFSSGEATEVVAASKAAKGGLSPALVSAVLVQFAAAWAQHEKVFKTLLAGAMSGVVSRTCTSPLEVLATLQMSGFGQAGTSMACQLGNIYATQGAAGFFRGNGANCLKVAPTRAIQFAVYERLKRWLVEQQKLKNQRHGLDPEAHPVTLSPQQRLVAGGLAGMCACSVVYPLEVVKTMLTVNPGAYDGIGGAFQHAFQEGGLRGFYKGWLPTMFAMFPYVGVEFMIYECGKKAYARQVARTQGPAADALPPLVHLCIGALAGMASQTAAHPLDVVRRRLQMQGKQGSPATGHANMFYCLYSLATEEGIRSLYRGLKPACAEKVPSTAITFFAYGVFKKLLGLSSI